MKTDWIIFCGLILRQKKPRDCFTVVSYTITEKNLYFSVSEVILVFHIAILREKPQLKYQRMVEINRKAFQIFQFLWSMTFFVFLSHQRGASWSSRRKPGLAWQQFIWWEKQLNAFQKLLTCAIITEQSLPWWWTEIIQYVVIQLIIVKFFLVQ